MQKTIFSVITLSALAFTFSMCSSSVKTGDETTKEEEKVNSNILNPLTADFSKPLDVKTLTESMQVYYQKEIQLIVYPVTYMDKEKFTDDLGCSAAADSDEKIVYLKFKTVPQKEFAKNTPYLIKCKVGSLSYFNELYLTDVELIGEAIGKSAVKFDPQAISETEIYNPKEILDNIMAWNGKKITIQGDYMSMTTSKTTDGTISELRADIGFPENHDLVVGCAFNEDPGTALPTGAKNVKISGEMDMMFHYDRPYMKNCVVK